MKIEKKIHQKEISVSIKISPQKQDVVGSQSVTCPNCGKVYPLKDLMESWGTPIPCKAGEKQEYELWCSNTSSGCTCTMYVELKCVGWVVLDVRVWEGLQ